MSPQRPLVGLVNSTDRFSCLPVPFIFGLMLAASASVAWAWTDVRVGLGFGLFTLGDWLMLVALPRFGRSYGPPQLPWLSLLVLRLLLAWIGALSLRAWTLPLVGGAQLGLLLIATYACWIEPARLGVTNLTFRSSHLNGCPPLRVLHLSDLHIERSTARETRLLDLVKQLAPDIIVVTGDYLNVSYTYDPLAQRHLRELLACLRAPAGVYAITGSPTVDPQPVVAQLLEGLDIVWLRDQVSLLDWHGCRVQIAGVECSYDIDADQRRLRALLDGHASRDLALLLYHTPDVMPGAVEVGIDLYLAGHTHGGQLRLPFFGALVTASIHGKRYEMGTYREGNTLLYVSRGVGMEGKGAPRARFLCPPEIVLFTLRGDPQ